MGKKGKEMEEYHNRYFNGGRGGRNGEKWSIEYWIALELIFVQACTPYASMYLLCTKVRESWYICQKPQVQEKSLLL